jgi:hypothetical protein
MDNDNDNYNDNNNDKIKRINYLNELNAINDKHIFENLENDKNNYFIKTTNIQESNKNVIQNRVRYVKTPYIFRSKL